MTSPWPLPPRTLRSKNPATSTQRSFSICEPSAVPVSLTLEARPSGAGELALSALTVTENVATVTLSDGVPGRVYTLNAVTVDESGDVTQVIRFLYIKDTLGIDPPPIAPSAGFGIPVTWPPNDVPISLQDGSGSWLFGDGTTIVWG